jgi:DNA-binding transcriptional LysR family regulator
MGPVDLVVVARRNHPRIGKKLEAATLNEMSHIALSVDLRGFTQVDRELMIHGIRRHIVMSVARLWSMPSIVAQTDLVGMIPRAFANHVAKHFDIEIHDVPVPISDQHLYMMWNTKLDADPAHTWVRDHMLKTAAAVMKPVAADPGDRVVKLPPAAGRTPRRTG